MSDQSLLQGLRQRKVIQWSLAYVTVAWVIAQAAEVVAGPWDIAPGWIRALHIVLVGGLPIAVILSWYHGERGVQPIRSVEITALSVVLAAMAFAFVAVDPFREQPTLDKAQALGRLGTISETLPRLAVIAFTNVGSPDDSYFADGITDELNSRLSGLRGLAVLSRSSAYMYRDSGRSAREIGQSLGADYVLHGTVRWDRRDANDTAVRVTPEIVRVEDDTQIWSVAYDRRFEDALSIQSEIATEVVSELDLVLSDRELQTIQTTPTRNPLAYEAFLRAIQVLPRGHGSERDFQKARTLARQSVTLDPQFALAWTVVAEADLGLYWYGYDTLESRLAHALESVEKALALDADLPDASMALGDYYRRRRNWDAALAEYSKVYELRPNDSEVIRRLAFIWRRLGLFAEGADALRQACDLDPLNAYDKLEYAWTLIYLGDYAEAEKQIQLAYDTDPTEEWIYLIGPALYWSRDGEGDLARAADLLSHFPDPRATYPAYSHVLQNLFEGNSESALRRVRDLAEPVLAVQAAYIPVALAEGLVLSAMGRGDEAHAAFAAAREPLELEYERNPGDFRLPLALGQVYAGLGLRDEALRAAQAAGQLMPVSGDALLGTDALYGQMEIYAMLGETKLALDTMAKLVAIPTHFRGAYFTRSPTFASLRQEQRFHDLLGK